MIPIAPVWITRGWIMNNHDNNLQISSDERHWSKLAHIKILKWKEYVEIRHSNEILFIKFASQGFNNEMVILSFSEVWYHTFKKIYSINIHGILALIHSTSNNSCLNTDDGILHHLIIIKAYTNVRSSWLCYPLSCRHWLKV